jgi:photosystem II stability/assembly factor-like uncharacterized protein
MKLLLKLIFAVLLFSSLVYSQWLPQNSGTNKRFMTSYFLNESIGWAAGDEGTIVKTTDGGITWLSQSVTTSDNIHSIHFVDPQNGWIALYGFTPDRHGRVMHTDNGGDTWTIQLSIFGATLHSIYFRNQLNGWVVGASGVTFHTTDGGQNWFEQYPTSGYWLYSVFFIDNETGWIAGNLLGQILKTTDGGSNWYSQSVPTYDFMMSMYFIDQNNGWAVGDGGRVVRTTNGGVSWLLAPSGTVQQLRCVRFVNINEGWAVGLGGDIIHSLDGGISWNTQSSNTTENLFGVSFVNNVQGWIAGENGTILVTNNGGIPVELVSFSAEVTDNSIQLSWITATEINNQGFDIERKLNNEWEKIGYVEGNGTTTEMHFYSFFDDISSLQISDKIFYRLKQIDFDGSFEYSDIVEVVVNQPNEFSLEQNYPNPFNPTTKIKFQIPETGYVRLKVFDILGNEVAVLINEELHSGNFKVEFNAANLSSGIYYYRLSAGEFIDVKKMILLK